MPNVSIRARLIFLSVLLLAILVVSSALLIRELARDSRSLAEEATLVSVVRSANSASKHFGDLKYWVIDSAVTQLARSQQAAAAAKAGLDSDLTAISDIIANPDGFDHRRMTIAGTVKGDLKFSNSHYGDNSYFSLCSTGCIIVICLGVQPNVHAGQSLTISGTFYARRTVGPVTFSNQFVAENDSLP